jgi:hypothetical protein
MFDIEKTTRFGICNTEDYVSVDSYANVGIHIDGEGSFDLTAHGANENNIAYLHALCEALSRAADELKKEAE